MDSSFDFIASLFYTFLFIKLVRYADTRKNGKCDVEVFCFLDEFANIRQIKNRYPDEIWQEMLLRKCLSRKKR